MSVPATAEEKTNKKNDVKAISLLLVALPNEHQLTFSQYSDAKTMFAAIETRFGGSRRLLVVWMNKADIETMSIDDLYNNFKIVEQDVKKYVGANTVSTVTPSVNTASPQVSTANFSDNAVYAFMVENLNGFNLLQQDLEQIHEDDLEVIDLKLQLSLLSLRAKRYFQRIGKKIFINANDTARYDKSKVECFNCHKMRHFARECRAPRNKDGQFKYQDNTKKQGNNEDTSSKAMLVIYGVGFDWSEMAEEQVQTNMALMAFSDSEVNNDKSCTKTCLKTYKTLKKQCDDLIVKLNQTEFKAATYKRGLTTVEEQLVTYKKNEVLFSEEVVVLKREVVCLKITNKNKKGLGYHVVPPPHPLIYNAPTKLDLSYSSLDEFKEPEFQSYGTKDSKLESTINSDKKSDDSKKNYNDSLVKEQVSKNESSFVESPLNADKETVFPTDKKIECVKPKNHEKPVRKSVRYAEIFDHVQINCHHHQRERMVSGNNYNRVDYDYYAKTSHPSAQRNMAPRAVLLKSGLTPLTTARPVYTAHPKPTVYSARSMLHFPIQAQSTVQRPFYKKTALTNRYFHQKVNTAKRHNYSNRTRAVNTAKAYTEPINVVRIKRVNTVKTSACWVWRPTRHNGASLVFKRHNYIDARGRSNGCSRHMTRNIAYLLDFKEFDRGYVTFGGGAHGGRISGKGTLKTDCLDFKDLPDESQILLKIPRQDNMYSFDMKNIVPKERKQLRASCKSKVLNLITKPLFMLHMDLFGPTFVSSLMHEKYCLVVTDDYSRTEFKNKVMDDFCREKGIRREYSVAMTPQQNRVAERRNMTLIEAARTISQAMISTAIPKFVMEHQLKAYPLAEQVIHKKRPLNPNQRRLLKEKVFEWLKEGVIRRVQYPGWLLNQEVSVGVKTRPSVEAQGKLPEKAGNFWTWYTVKKVTSTNSYEFLFANKKCLVDAEVFKKILNICLRVQGVDFTEVLDYESTLTSSLILVTKCYFGKAASNDRLRKSRIDILWGMFYRGNVDYPELIWEDFAFQIDNRQLKKANMKSCLTPDDGVVNRLTFVRTGEDFQEYRLPFPETILTERIKQSESYQIFIKYSTSLIPAKKSRDDNIIPEPDIAFELGKSMTLTEAAKEEAARQVHATYEWIMTESVPEPARRRHRKLKGVQTLTPEEQLAADTMQALKASKKSSISRSLIGGSGEGTGVSPRVPDESTVNPATSKQDSEYSKKDQGDDEDIPWEYTNEDEVKKDDDDVDDDKSIDLEKTDDEFMHSEEYDDEDEEMTNTKDADNGNSDEEIADAAKADAEKEEEVKDDIKKAKLPPSCSSLSVSLGFGNQFLNLSSDTSLIVLTPIPEIPLVTPATTLLPHLFVFTISPVLLQSTTPIPTPPITIEAPPATTIPNLLPAIIQRVFVLEKVVQEIKEVDHTTTLLASFKS
ncbi:putative ribonuclease H-like domain-containing protein [Tanacetum coccineum]